MLGRNIARIIALLILIALANAIKPFTVKNITSHLLYSSRSLAFVLPDSMRSRFDHANHLALSLSNSLFSDKQTGPGRPDLNSEYSLAVKHDTFADLPELDAEAAVKMTRFTFKRKPVAVKRVVEAHQITPVVLPAPRLSPAVFQLSRDCPLMKQTIYPLKFRMVPPQRIRVIYQLKNTECDKPTLRQISMATATYIEATKRKLRVEWLECEEKYDENEY